MSQPSDTIAPLSTDRIRAALDALEWKHRTDSDGDVSGGWSDGFYYFLARGDEGHVLVVRGTWYGRLPIERLPEALEVCTEWNMETIWPKAYPRVAEDGTVGIHAEHNTDTQIGITDRQLQLHLFTAVNAGAQFFAKLNETFPEVVPGREG